MITLSTLYKATEQEVFDQVAKHLLTQKVRSANPYCKYRLKTNDGVLKCAAGCLISDEEYYEGMECLTWTSHIFPPYHKEFIRKLQKIHDLTAPSDWINELKYLAEEHNLNTDILQSVTKKELKMHTEAGVTYQHNPGPYLKEVKYTRQYKDRNKEYQTIYVLSGNPEDLIKYWNRGSWKYELITTETERLSLAKEIAQYILDGDGERDSYEEYIENGNDPRDHVYYKAAVVLGRDDEFQEDLNKYEGK